MHKLCISLFVFCLLENVMAATAVMMKDYPTIQKQDEEDRLQKEKKETAAIEKIRIRYCAYVLYKGDMCKDLREAKKK